MPSSSQVLAKARGVVWVSACLQSTVLSDPDFGVAVVKSRREVLGGVVGCGFRGAASYPCSNACFTGDRHWEKHNHKSNGWTYGVVIY